MKFIISIFSSFTIWVLSAMLNAILSGTVVWFFSGEFNYWPSAIILVFIFSLLFSVPGILLFWMILLVNWESEELFRILLKAGLIISSLSSLLVFILPVGMDKYKLLLLSLCIVITTTASIMLHHNILLSITAKSKNENYV